MLKINQLAALACFAPAFLFGQIHDDFSDGNHSDNPAWQGNTTHFKINAALELQLNAPAAGQSSLVLAANIPDSAVWEIKFRLEFAPSASNRLRVYLMADVPDLASANGYFLEIGENGTADGLRFFRQKDGAADLLAVGPASTLGGDPALARIQVVRKTGGSWKIGADFSGGDSFLPQMEFLENELPGGQNRFFGFDCLFSASRKDKFFFDDLQIKPDLPDTSPPLLLAAEAINQTSLLAVFNENLDAGTAADPTHFSVSQIGQPTVAEPVSGNPKAVKLTVGQPFLDGKTYSLTAVGLADEAGNVAAASQSASFLFLKISPPGPFDLLINEIMADPSPTVGLPDVEWIEIINRSAKNIDLQGVTFSAGSSEVVLPSHILRPDSLLLLLDEADEASFFLIKNRLALPGFPTLTNSAADLRLVNSSGEIIDLVSYDLSFYKSPDKKDGGWSLELRNPQSPCLSGNQNWAACANLPGGTPGLPNAILNLETDVLPPELLAVFPNSATELSVRFSKKMNPTTTSDLANFEIKPPLEIASVSLADDGISATLFFSEAMQNGLVYDLKIADPMTDCAGVFISEKNTARFALPELPEANDLIINELLFNAAPDGFDFIEILNRSNKAISLAGLFLGNVQTTSVSIKKIEIARLVFPGEMAVLTESTADILSRFEVKNPAWLHQNDLPTFADDGGNARLFRQNGPTSIVVLDEFNFSKDLHHALLADLEKEGRSLERLAADRPTNDPTNWQTAAETAGNATPTGPNSQAEPTQTLENQWLLLSSKRVSPDGDGFEDSILMDLNLPKSGFVGQISIFNEAGRRAKLVTAESLVGPQPRFRWDGDLDDGGPASSGIYLLQAEFLHPDGEVLRQKVAVAVVRGF